MKKLSAIAVCGGPGSYTGLRIGLATAKGLCFALDIPLILHDRLRILAWQGIRDAPEAALYISLLQARADEYFIGVYSSSKEILAPRHYTKEQIAELFESYRGMMIVVIGHMPPSDRDMSDVLYLDNIQIIPDVWAEQSLSSWAAREFADPASAEPFYLKSVFIANKK